MRACCRRNSHPENRGRSTQQELRAACSCYYICRDLQNLATDVHGAASQSKFDAASRAEIQPNVLRIAYELDVSRDQSRSIYTDRYAINGPSFNR
jgi:hypothetical protein